ncbi:MAG: SulP family inorganic anion transporter [Lachnospiraceae bacterium]|nr:SulP family inorganic anion transporter [Lachnospiraceae bacterium]
MLKSKAIKHPLNDILTGIIIALVSIPISMGYAQISGLPSVYGLYGSLFPILVYGLITTSPQFIVGVDAMPAAMVGTLLTTELSIAPDSKEAMDLIPLISLMVAIWFIIFFLLKAGNVVRFISSPVMGGFISGVGATIILMQIPKLFGGEASSGEAIDLFINIYNEASDINPVSLLLGAGTMIIILSSKKFLPRVPVTALMLPVGALLQICLKLDDHGVKLLPQVPAGLPPIHIPDLNILTKYSFFTLAVESLSIAAVIMAQTLLATGSYASKYDDPIDNNRELLAYSGMNIASALVGCCPINGSVSRSGIADSYKGRSQIISVSSALTMCIILLFGTPLLKYLPVPILTAIVICALIGIIDVKMFKRLLKYSKSESIIFLSSFLAVLLFGTINGVFIGCFLSFGEIAVRGVVPPTTFLGRIPGHGNFHTIGRNKHACPIKNTIIYRFSGNLFFANIDKLENDIKKALRDDTRQVVIDARGIGSIDITALDRLISFKDRLNNRGIRFYIAEHDSSLNDSIRKMGGKALIDTGVIRRTITLALSDAGLEKPYELEETDYYNSEEFVSPSEEHTESEWAYGHAENKGSGHRS